MEKKYIRNIVWSKQYDVFMKYCNIRYLQSMEGKISKFVGRLGLTFPILESSLQPVTWNIICRRLLWLASRMRRPAESGSAKNEIRRHVTAEPEIRSATGTEPTAEDRKMHRSVSCKVLMRTLSNFFTSELVLIAPKKFYPNRGPCQVEERQCNRQCGPLQANVSTFFKKWVILGLFFFIFVFSTQLTVNVQYNFLPMTGFEPQTSGFGSDRSISWVTTPAHVSTLFNDLFPHIPSTSMPVKTSFESSRQVANICQLQLFT